MQVNQFLVAGMVTSAHAQHLARALDNLPGVRKVHVALSEQAVRVEHDDHVRVQDMLQAIRRAGFAEVSVLV